MIRLITCTCAGRAYLNFMGNEFGHPGVSSLFLPQSSDPNNIICPVTKSFFVPEGRVSGGK